MTETTDISEVIQIDVADRYWTKHVSHTVLWVSVDSAACC